MKLWPTSTRTVNGTRRKTRQILLGVACPKCGAQPGRLCQRRSGTRVSHPERVAELKKKGGKS